MDGQRMLFFFQVPLLVLAEGTATTGQLSGSFSSHSCAPMCILQ